MFASAGSSPLIGAERITLLRAGLEVLRGVGAGAEAPGGLDHDVDAEFGPRQLGRVALARSRRSGGR